MALHPHVLPPVPETTAAAVPAAFPKGNLSVDLRAEFGTLYTDQLFAVSLRPRRVRWKWRPGAWRWSWGCSISKGSPIARRRIAVRRCMDWKYALSLDL